MKFNTEKINQHKLEDSILAEGGIEKLHSSEIFVEHPSYKGYYISQFGRAVSLKKMRAKLLKAFIGGQIDRQYLYYSFVKDGQKHTVSVHRAVADVYCPNFWPNRKRLEAHHIDGDKFNNYYRNLILLTPELHAKIHTIKKIALFKDSKIIEYKNLLDLIYDTGLKLEEVLQIKKSKKPLKSNSRYTVFNIKGYLIGLQYYSQRKKTKNN